MGQTYSPKNGDPPIGNITRPRLFDFRPCFSRPRPAGRRRDREPGGRADRDGDRRQARRDRPGADGVPGRRPRADRGHPRCRQDDPGESPGPRPGPGLQAGPVHARPAARRHHRHDDLQPEDGPVRVPRRAGLRQRRAGRRDQPGDPQDPVQPARMHGRAAGDDRRHHLHPPAPVLRHRDREPHRVPRHVPAARGAARPLPAAPVAGLPRRGGRSPASWPSRPASGLWTRWNPSPTGT